MSDNIKWYFIIKVKYSTISPAMYPDHYHRGSLTVYFGSEKIQLQIRPIETACLSLLLQGLCFVHT